MTMGDRYEQPRTRRGSTGRLSEWRSPHAGTVGDSRAKYTQSEHETRGDECGGTTGAVRLYSCTGLDETHQIRRCSVGAQGSAAHAVRVEFQVRSSHESRRRGGEARGEAPHAASMCT